MMLILGKCNCTYDGAISRLSMTVKKTCYVNIIIIMCHYSNS